MAALWDEELQRCGEDLTERSWNKKTYPAVEEMLAYMAARSPTFYGGLTELLQNHSRFVYRTRWAGFSKLLDLAGGISNTTFFAVEGLRKLTSFFNRIAISKGQILTAEEFTSFANDVSRLVMESNRPKGLAGLYGKAFLEVVYHPSELKIWRTFSELLMERRKHFESFLSRTSLDFAGDFSGKVDPHFEAALKQLPEGYLPKNYVKPRDAVLFQMYRFGIMDTVINRIAGVKKNGKNAVRVESEMLVGEVLFFVRPVMSPIFLYLTYVGVNTALDMQSESLQQKDNLEKGSSKKVQTNPDNNIEGTKHIDVEALRGYEQSIRELTLKRFDIETRLQAKQSDSEIRDLRQQLEEIKVEIDTLQKKKLRVQSGN